MPELPDVEVFRRYAGSTSLHKKIEEVEVRDDRIMEGIERSDLEDLSGSEFEDPRRRGKYLFLKAGKRWVVMHFGMTGRLKYFRDRGPDHQKVMFRFENGYNLAYVCTRVLGKITLTGSPREYAEENDIGPDIMDIGRKEFVSRLSGKRGRIKSALMDQSLMSGLGNIYADEVLFQAGYHPGERVSDIEEDGLEELYGVVQDVLSAAVEARADPGELPDGYLIPLRGKEGKCPRDGAELKRIRVGGRSTYLCPKHQRMR